MVQIGIHIGQRFMFSTRARGEDIIIVIGGVFQPHRFINCWFRVVFNIHVVQLTTQRYRCSVAPLSPVHTSNDVEATLSNATSQIILSSRQCRNKMNMFNLIRFNLVEKTNFATKWFGIVARNGRNALSKQHSTLSKESFDL